MEKNNQVELTGKVSGNPEVIKVNNSNLLKFDLCVVTSKTILDKTTDETSQVRSSAFIPCKQFVKDTDLDSVLGDVVKQGNVVTLKAYLDPEQYVNNQGKQINRNALRCTEIKPYVKAAEGEQSNQRNMIELSGNLTSDAFYNGTSGRLIHFTLAYDNGAQGDKRRTGYIDVNRNVKKEDLSSMKELLKKGSPVTIKGMYQADEFTNRAGEKQQELRVVAFNIERTSSKESSSNETAEQPKPQINRLELLSSNVDIVDAMMREGVNIDKLTDSQIYRVLSQHKAIDLKVGDKTKHFIPQKGVDNNYTIKVSSERLISKSKNATNEK